MRLNDLNSKTSAGSATSQDGKKEYKKPQLVCYGDVRTVTLAPTPGGFVESGYNYLTRTGTPPTNG